MDVNTTEPVSGGPSPNGKWELLSTPENNKSGGGEPRAPALGKGKTFEQRLADRLNSALDDSIDGKSSPPQLKSPGGKAWRQNSNGTTRRQNATLEDFMSPGKNSSGRGGVAKRNRQTQEISCLSPVVSPPHKSHRMFSPKRGNENRSTTRFIKDICQKLKEPKHNLMKKVLEQKGRVFIIDLVAQVEEVEKSGGQFVADGSRRRTKGGVFLNLLKSQCTKEQWDTIFEDEKEAQVRKQASEPGPPTEFDSMPLKFLSLRLTLLHTPLLAFLFFSHFENTET